MGATGFTVERLEERRHGHELEEAHPEDDLPAIAAAPQVKKNDPGLWQRIRKVSARARACTCVCGTRGGEEMPENGGRPVGLWPIEGP